MSTTRIKRTGAVIKSRAEMESIVGEIRELKVQEQKLIAERNALLQTLDERFAPRLREIASDVEQKVGLVQVWAEANPTEFGNRKSIETPHGLIGFRTGTEKLKTLLRWKWDMVLDAIKSHMPTYVRVKEDVNKEAIISAHRAGEITNEQLRKVGCEVVQDESFFVEPKLEEVETREVASV